MNNECVFSSCRKWRYVLRHSWSDLLDPEEKAVMWIGLNPSTADENQLDPTLRRIKGFSQNWGYNCFYMTNIFAFRATLPPDMKASEDPVGPENDHWLAETAKKTDLIVCAWGTHGIFKGRGAAVAKLLKGLPGKRSLACLGYSKNGDPMHPLYIPYEAERLGYPPSES